MKNSKSHDIIALEVIYLKKVLRIGGIVLSAILLIAISYLLYVVISYNRVEDNLTLDIQGELNDNAPVNESLTLVTYNIGFGAYSDDYSFFMDGGEHSRAFSKDAVIANTNGALGAIKSQNPDFVLLQEVDIDGTRSYHVNQRDIIANEMRKYEGVFALNYNSPYFLYPFNEPIGANKSGLLSFSRYNITSSIRRSLPIEESFNKFIDLDRAYTRSIIEAVDGKKLVLYNVHLSAYTSDGSIANKQLKMLSEDMKSQYDKGNYIIAAGDFNKDLLGDSSKYFERSEGEFNWAAPFDSSLLPSGFLSHTGSNVPTCRNADSPFRGDGTDFVLSVDGIIVSDNIKVISCDTVDTGFKFSDHNPVKADLILMSNN